VGGLPCKEKIILNGGDIVGVLEYLCQRVQAPGTVELSEDAGYKIVELLNTAEDAVFRAQRVWLESQGFTGPWPHAMNYKDGSS
jgi:hypothetical protein